MRHALSDAEWRLIAPTLPRKSRGAPRVDDRRVLNGIFWILRSGAPWRGSPERYGPYTTCYNRFVRWRRAGVWDRILTAISRRDDSEVQMIDRMIVRAHQHASCIRNGASKGLGRPRGGWANIPPRRNRRDPICFSPCLYRHRNHVERFFNRIKQCRRVASRYEKQVANVLAFVKLAAIQLWLSVNESTAKYYHPTLRQTHAPSKHYDQFKLDIKKAL